MNGAERAEVEPEEADELLEQYGPWARVIERPTRATPGVIRSVAAPWLFAPVEPAGATRVEVEDQDEDLDRAWPPPSPAEVDDLPF